MKLHDACRRFLHSLRSTKNLSEHTHRAYSGDLRDFQRFAGSSKPVLEFDKALLESYIHHLLRERKLKETTVKRRLACLRLLFSWLEDEEALSLSPFHRLKVRIRLPKRLPRFLDRANLRSLLLHLAKELGISWKGDYDASKLSHCLSNHDFVLLSTLVSVETLFATGIRVGELTRIRIQDLHIKEGVIEIQGKGNRERQVYLPGRPLRCLLNQYLEARMRQQPSTNRLLILPSANPATTQHIRMWLHRSARSAGIEQRVTPHMLRHTAATYYLEAGLDIRHVQRLLGHTNITTTQIYTHVSDTYLRQAVVEYCPRRLLLTA